MTAKLEFGDYQTPPALALYCCHHLAGIPIRPPASILEPTCGAGAFLEAALATFPNTGQAVGVELNPGHATEAARRLPRATILQQNFFTVDWDTVLAGLADPLLVIGNPPWVTNSAIGAVNGHNLPEKHNRDRYRGLDAITGKSNFDISEWMLTHLARKLSGRNATLAMLVKTAVARKVLHSCWKEELALAGARIFPIDAARYFNAAVDACLLVCLFEPHAASRECLLGETSIGYRDRHLIADLAAHNRWRHLQGAGNWRSGIKHDCAKVMEFHYNNGALTNGFGETVDIEPDRLYPLLKSSGVANGCLPERWVLVSQSHTGDDTATLEHDAPKTWAYLQSHRARLDARRSSIYAGRPPFSIFGIGDYSFAPWKVAISGFYKRLHFRVIGPAGGKPVMVDDTVYFLPCRSQSEAQRLDGLLNSNAARGFFQAFIFWDAKRPITATLLNRLSLERLAGEP